MAKGSRKRKGVAWELVGIVAILAVFLVGGLWWSFSRGEADPADVQLPMYTVLQPGEDMETGLTADGRPYMGSANAPVTIYEFADFQCPHCRDFARTGAVDMKNSLLASGRARLVWVNFPVLGDESNQAAKGAFCAAEQGAFWTYHDYAFANQPIRSNSGAFSSQRLVAMAEAIPELDHEAFEACLSASETARMVQDDIQFAGSNSVGSTPSFLIGDTVVVGGPMSEIEAAVVAAGG